MRWNRQKFAKNNVTEFFIKQNPNYLSGEDQIWRISNLKFGRFPYSPSRKQYLYKYNRDFKNSEVRKEYNRIFIFMLPNTTFSTSHTGLCILAFWTCKICFCSVRWNSRQRNYKFVKKFLQAQNTRMQSPECDVENFLMNHIWLNSLRFDTPTINNLR